jgi:hypothetical protein
MKLFAALLSPVMALTDRRVSANHLRIVRIA